MLLTACGDSVHIINRTPWVLEQVEVAFSSSDGTGVVGQSSPIAARSDETFQLGSSAHIGPNDGYHQLTFNADGKKHSIALGYASGPPGRRTVVVTNESRVIHSNGADADSSNELGGVVAVVWLE